jgi:biopolymer transport protein ExbD
MRAALSTALAVVALGGGLCLSPAEAGGGSAGVLACASSVMLFVQDDGAIVLDSAPVALPDLLAVLDARGGADSTCRVMVRTSETASYSVIKRVLDVLESGGYEKIALISEGSGFRE